MGRTKRRRKHVIKNKRNFQYVGDDADMILFNKWLKRFNFKNFQKLVPCMFSQSGRGLQTRKFINVGEPLVIIPKSLIITVSSIDSSTLGQMFHRSEEHFSAQVVLTCFLVWEKLLNKNSEWFPYINMLPTSASSPLFLTAEEQSCLPHYLSTFTSAEIKFAEISISKVLPTFKEHLRFLRIKWKCDLHKEFLWAWAMVKSRSVYVKPNKNVLQNIKLVGQDTMAMIPFLDLLNHSSAVETNVEETENGFILSTDCHIKPYEQVFINYGAHSNINLYLNYGYVDSVNHNDIVYVPLDDIKFCIKKIYPDFDMEVTLEEKSQFLSENGLISEIGLTIEGLTFHAKTVICILLSADFNSSINKRLFQEEYSETEKECLYLIGNCLTDQQIEIYKDCLTNINKVKQLSDSFNMAKKLVELYCFQLFPQCKESLFNDFKKS